MSTDNNSETTMSGLLQALEKVFKEFIQYIEIKTTMEQVSYPLLHPALVLM